MSSIVRSAWTPRSHADLRRADGTGWAVMTDPEGNEFCVELTRSADRFAAGRPGGGPSMTE